MTPSPVAVVADWAYGGVRWLRSLVPWPRRPQRSDARPNAVPVVLVPGIYERWRFAQPLAAALASAGYRVVHVPGLGFNQADLAPSAQRVLAALREADVRGGVLVAHSKGGLIGKRVLLDADGAARLCGMVTLATPFAGSALSWRWLARTPLGLFASTGPAIMMLAAELAVNSRIVSLIPTWDQVIEEGSALAGARNIELSAGGHFRPLADPDVHAIIVREVGRLVEEQEPR